MSVLVKHVIEAGDAYVKKGRGHIFQEKQGHSSKNDLRLGVP